MEPFKSYSLNLKGRLVTIDRPWVMGIINVTPDSFYSGSRVADEQTLIERVRAMVADGADVIDVGACSTRPGSASVDARGEMERLQWALAAIRRELPDVILSIDTYRAEVARRCVEEWGADIINDISGGTIDGRMFATVANIRSSIVPPEMSLMMSAPHSSTQRRATSAR